MSEEWYLKRMYHTVINAKDINETVAFYEELGFRILSERRNMHWPDGSGVFFGLIPNAKGRGGVLMELPHDPNGPVIDIIQWIEPKATFPEISPTVIPRIICFHTHNVPAAMKALQAKGYRTTTKEPHSAKEAGILASGFVYDPNGHLVELMELEPGLRTSKYHEIRGQDKYDV